MSVPVKVFVKIDQFCEIYTTACMSGSENNVRSETRVLFNDTHHIYYAAVGT